MNPTVSVLMPAYNSEGYIGEAIESVLDQTFRDFELIIIDDCSTDDTWQKIRNYAEKDHRIKIYKNQSNLKISATRNKLLSLAQGKYIVWHDSDDISLPYRIEHQYRFMENNPKVGICGGYLQYFDGEKDIGVRKYAITDRELRNKIFRYSPVAQPAAIIRKECFEKVGDFSLEQNVAEDLELSFKIGEHYEFANLPEIILKYRQVNSGATFKNLSKIEKFTLDTRKRYAKSPAYHMNLVDRGYNLLQRLSMYIIPAHLKIWIFNYFRNSRKVEKVTDIVLCQGFLPGGGGIENNIHQTVQEIVRFHQRRVEIITFEKDKSKTAIFDIEYNVPVFRIRNPFNKWAEYLSNNFNSLVGGVTPLNFIGRLSMLFVGTSGIAFLFIAAWKRVHKNKGPIIFFCFSLAAVFVAVVIRFIFPWRKFGIVFNNGFVYQKSKFALVDFILTKTLQSIDYSICISGASGVVLQKAFGLDKDKVVVYKIWISEKTKLPNINETSLLDESIEPIESKSIYGEKINILFVGRVVPEKGIQEIIDLATLIDQQKLSDRYHITIVGDSLNPIVETLREASKKIYCLTYVGRIDKPELWEFYKKGDIFLMPSTWEEGSGNVILEAAWFGLPVVGSNRGGIPEIIKTFTYYGLITDFSPKAMLSVIDKLRDKIKEVGKVEVSRSLKKTVEQEFSSRNFNVHEKVLDILTKRLEGQIKI